MQRVMNDPEYRARFQKMSQQEKEAELRKNMGTIAPPTPEQHQEGSQPPIATSNETATAMAIRNELGQMAQHIGEIDPDSPSKITRSSTSKGSHDEFRER